MKYTDGPPIDDFYVKPFPRDSGYLWYFPLEKGHGYVGAGDFDKKQVEYVDGYNKAHPGEVEKRIGRPIRFLSPGYCEPFYEGNVVGVGEAIGTVFPMLGEGIIPSIQCCDILMETMPDFKKYRAKVLKHYQIFDECLQAGRPEDKGQVQHDKERGLDVEDIPLHEEEGGQVRDGHQGQRPAPDHQRVTLAFELVDAAERAKGGREPRHEHPGGPRATPPSTSSRAR